MKGNPDTSGLAKTNHMQLDDEAVLEQDQFEALIQGLIDDKFGCCSDFVLPSTALGLLANMAMLTATGEMKAAGIGSQMDFQKDSLIRGDTMHWIDRQSTNAYEMIYLKKIQKFIDYLNKTCFTSITSFESHYANYGQGSFYKRHIDQFKNETGRKYSVVLYLNQDWQEEDGGKLTLYPAAGLEKQVSPVSGRMVFFRSDEMEHEVQPSLTRERRSIAGWFKN